MLPIWKHEENDAGTYDRVHVHSPGVVSFVYDPVDVNSSELLKKTETYRRSVQQRETAAENGHSSTIPDR